MADARDLETIQVYFNKASGPGSPGCAEKATTLAGSSQALLHVGVTLDTKEDLATITIQGPATVWFGAGFGARAMQVVFLSLK